MPIIGIGNILLALLILSFNASVFFSEFTFWLKNRTPASVSCARYLESIPIPSHVKLSECEFDWNRTIEISFSGNSRKKHYCTPIYPRGEKTFKMSLFLVSNRFVPSQNRHSLEGMILKKNSSHPFLSSLRKKFSDYLDPNFIVLIEGEKPSLKKALVSLAFCFLAIIALLFPYFFYSKRIKQEKKSRRRKKRTSRLKPKVKEQKSTSPSEEEASQIAPPENPKEQEQMLSSQEKPKEKPKSEKENFAHSTQQAPLEKDLLDPEVWSMFAQSTVKTPDNAEEILEFACPRCQWKTSMKKEFKPFGKKKRCKGCGGIYNLSKKTLIHKEMI